MLKHAETIPHYIAIFHIETILEDRESNYSYISEERKTIEAQNITEAFNIALKYADQKSSQNQTIILEGLVFNGLFSEDGILKHSHKHLKTPIIKPPYASHRI